VLRKLENLLLSILAKVPENLFLKRNKFLNAIKNGMTVLQCNNVEGTGLPNLAF